MGVYQMHAWDKMGGEIFLLLSNMKEIGNFSMQPSKES
jgi:hypothetical protein